MTLKTICSKASSFSPSSSMYCSPDFTVLPTSFRLLALPLCCSVDILNRIFSPHVCTIVSTAFVGDWPGTQSHLHFLHELHSRILCGKTNQKMSRNAYMNVILGGNIQASRLVFKKSSCFCISMFKVIFVRVL